MRDYADEMNFTDTRPARRAAERAQKRAQDLRASRLMIEAVTSGPMRSRAFDLAASAMTVILTVLICGGLVAAVYALTS